MLTVVVRITTAVMKYHHQKEEREFFGLCLYMTVHCQRKPGQEFWQGSNLEIGAETMLARVLLTGLLPMLFSVCFLLVDMKLASALTEQVLFSN